jgi:uncharacterized protein YjdB
MASKFTLRRDRLAFATILGVLSLSSCTATDSSSGPSDDPADRVVTEVRVLPESTAVVVGANLFFSADVRDDRGQQVVNAGVVWSSSDTSIASVDTLGAVRVRGTGFAEIRAAARGKQGFSRLLSTPVPVASVSVTPSISTLQSGSSTTLIARTLSSADSVLSGRAVVWGSSDSNVASVDANGNVSANALGSATIRAISEGQIGIATVTVVAPPPPPAPSAVTDVAISSVTDTTMTVRFTEVGDGVGAPANYIVRFSLPPLTWATANNVVRGTCVGALSGSSIGAVRTCTIRGLLPSTSYRVQLISYRGTIGQGEVYGPLSNTASGITAVAPVASVTINPSSPTVVTGASTTLTAIARDAAGNTLTGRAVTWSSTATSIATVGSNGVATGVAAGTSTVRATVEGVTGGAPMVVTLPPPTLVGVSLTPPFVTMTTGSSHQFAVTGLLSNGSTSSVSVTYTATGGTVSATGRFVAGSVPGNYRVIATVTGGSLADTSRVTVNPAVEVQPMLVEDFSTYVSTSHLHADPRNIYNSEEFGGPWGQWNLIELDTTTGVSEVGLGTSRKSMKFTWPNRTNATGVQPDANRCADFYILKGIPITPVQELWGEFWVKFSPNWTSKAPASWNCASNPDYKFIFFGTLPSSRFSIKNDYAGLGTRWDPTAPGQGDGDNNFQFNNFHDGQWHRVRMHAKVASGGANGIHEVWLDDVLVYSRTGITTLNQTSIYLVNLGNNLNQGPGHVQTLHWGAIRLYNQNPGW